MYTEMKLGENVLSRKGENLNPRVQFNSKVENCTTLLPSDEYFH